MACARVCVYTYAYICTCTQVCMVLHICCHTYIQVDMYPPMYAYNIYVCMYICMYIGIYAYVYTHIVWLSRIFGLAVGLRPTPSIGYQ